MDGALLDLVLSNSEAGFDILRLSGSDLGLCVRMLSATEGAAVVCVESTDAFGRIRELQSSNPLEAWSNSDKAVMNKYINEFNLIHDAKKYKRLSQILANLFKKSSGKTVAKYLKKSRKYCIFPFLHCYTTLSCTNPIIPAIVHCSTVF